MTIPPPPRRAEPWTRDPRTYLIGIGALIAALFLVAVLVQVAASGKPDGYNQGYRFGQQNWSSLNGGYGAAAERSMCSGIADGAMLSGMRHEATWYGAWVDGCVAGATEAAP